MDGPVLVVEELARCFGPAIVLSGVGFALEVGRSAAVVGPNGRARRRCCAVSSGPTIPMLADRTPVGLSSGERRRLALASCFVRPRRLLVLDEPEQRLDAAGRRWLIERLRREKAAGCAVLFASHHTTVVGLVGDSVIALGG